jgi:hypothetical protein
MTSSHSIAAWLLERMGIDVGLTGDLEECALGRSVMWYWGQVLMLVWIGTWNVILHNKLLALRAVATGCAVNYVWLLLWLRFLPLRFPGTPMISIELIPWLLIILFAHSVTGWVVARTHRAHPVPMVVVFAMWLGAWFVVDSVPWLRGLLMYSNLINQTGSPRLYFVSLAWSALPEFAVVTGLLLGGVLGARQKSGASDGESCQSGKGW